MLPCVITCWREFSKFYSNRLMMTVDIGPQLYRSQWRALKEILTTLDRCESYANTAGLNRAVYPAHRNFLWNNWRWEVSVLRYRMRYVIGTSVFLKVDSNSYRIKHPIPQSIGNVLGLLHILISQILLERALRMYYKLYSLPRCVYFLVNLELIAEVGRQARGRMEGKK